MKHVYGYIIVLRDSVCVFRLYFKLGFVLLLLLTLALLLVHRLLFESFVTVLGLSFILLLHVLQCTLKPLFFNFR